MAEAKEYTAKFRVYSPFEFVVLVPLDVTDRVAAESAAKEKADFGFWHLDGEYEDEGEDAATFYPAAHLELLAIREEPEDG